MRMLLFWTTRSESNLPRSAVKVINLIGQGTFGKVVRAWDREQQCFKAVKIIRAVQKYREAAYVEIRVLKKLKEKDPRNEKRCIHLVEHFDHRNHVCMVFDLLDKSIFDFLKENDFNPFPYTQIRDFAYQLLKAVAFLHDELKLVHTDLKPENLMLVNAMSVHINESKVRFEFGIGNNRVSTGGGNILIQMI